MKFDLETALKTLGWPLGLIAVFSSVLLLFGVQLDVVLMIAGSMLGLQALFSLLIDVLKYIGVIYDGNAGRWSAALNLIGLAGIAVVLWLNPTFDFPRLDAQLVIIAQFGSLIFAYIVQIAGTRQVHLFVTQGLGIWRFSLRQRQLMAFKDA
ncbi:MAG: hypothetical protein EHM40_03280 [Chloroflexi bacterium]|nr:MAG: hypothetical protein EHM40_03280 [Chloroflexota bacterium]